MKTTLNSIVSRLILLLLFFTALSFNGNAQVDVTVTISDNCMAPLPNSGTYTASSTVNGKTSYVKGSNLRIIWTGSQWELQADDPSISAVNWFAGWYNTANTTNPPSDCWSASFGCFPITVSGTSTSPVVNVSSILRANTNPTSSSSVDYTVTFSGTINSLSTSNFSLTTTGAITGTSVSSVSQTSGSVWSVTVNTGSNDGTLKLNFANATGASAGVCNAPYTSGAVYTVTRGLSATQSQTNLTCNGVCTGSGTVTASGGTSPYTYSWAPSGGSGATASSLCAGSYTCTITDAASASISKTFTITQPSAISVSAVSQTNVACNGGSTGAAGVSASGGTGGYTYDWTPGTPTGDGTTSITGLAAGTWTCTVTDANSCTATRTFSITQPSAISSSGSQNNVSCNGGTNGTATVTPSGGTPSYTYSWAPSGGTAATTTGRAAGTYTVTITDANSCTATRTFNITQPTALTASTSQTNVSCNGGTNGTATVTPSGGTSSYSYSWAPSGGTGSTASGLASGNYTVTVTDANSCQITRSFNITQPAALTASTSQTNVSCNGGTNGTATVTPSGGTSSYTYSWAPSGGTGATGTGLANGNYTVTITDANSCQITRTFNITQPSGMSVTAASQTNVSCNGGSTGAASINTPTGGAGSYTYDWTPGTPTGDGTTSVTGLTAGTWTCTVTDANSCTTTQTFSITQPSAISATAASQTNVACNGGSNGAASVNNASGGTGGYTYDWTPGTPTGDGTTSITGLTAGTWTVTVTDANSCTATQTFNITQPAVLTASAASQTNVSCNGGSNGAASVSASGGAGGYTYDWTPGTPTGDGTTSITGLTAGTWSCTVTDANSCTATQTFNITQPSSLSVTAASQTNVSCNGGSTGAASINTPTGGAGSYTYNWTGTPTGDGTTSVTGLTAGTWTCTVTDANSCTATQTFSITQPSAINFPSTGQTNLNCNGGSTGAAFVNASGGTGGFTYNWTPGNPTGDGTNSVTGLTAGTWTVTVTDANSCTVTRTFNLTQPSAISLTAASQTNVACIGYSTGAASVNAASGGTGSFTYDWTPGTPTGDGTTSITGLKSGTYTCTVTDANSCTATQTFTITQPATEAEINVTGNSVTIADGDATPSGTDHTDFGNQNLIGGTMVRTFTIENPGTANLNISSVTITGVGASDYTITSTHSTPVSASGSTSFQVTFDPSTNGVKNATITIITNDCDEGTYDFAITGTGSAQEINLKGNNTSIVDGDASPSLSDHTSFGDLAPSASLSRTYIIQNTGTARLDLSNIALSGTDASLFSISGITVPDTITPGDSLTFTVSFTPTSGGLKTASVTITSNDADEGTYDFAIQGERNCYTHNVTATLTNDGVNTGGVPTNIYLGYGAQKDTLKAIGFGANVTWSPATNLSCTTCTTTVFAPTTAGTYVFTASNGCISKQISICVASISAGGTGARSSVYLCHMEPVTNVTRTLAVLLRGVPSHFNYHPGDKLGTCGSSAGGGSGSGCTLAKRQLEYSELVVDEMDLEITCTPNPFRQSFKLDYHSSSDEDATIMIYGMTGNLVENISLNGFSNEIVLGSNLPNGIYTVSFLQGDKTRFFRMIKVD